MERTTVARWESRGGKYWVELYRDAWGFTYRGNGCGGNLGDVSEVDAVSNIESRLDTFQADANKSPMRRIR